MTGVQTCALPISVVDMQGDRRCNDCIICSEYAMTLQNGSLRCYSFECYGNIMISRLVCDNLTIGGTEPIWVASVSDVPEPSIGMMVISVFFVIGGNYLWRLI